jgi:phage tail-like protein
MDSNTLLPPIPQPPNDPTWLLLNSRVGWFEAQLDRIEENSLGRELTLALAPGAGRSRFEPSSSFGGLTLPNNVALAPEGSIYLLDSKTLTLKRFDPCQCAFETVPGFGGVGSGPRQLRDPHGIGICRDNLFVCDTGNHRLQVFALHGFVLRAIWQPPAPAGLANAWEPFAVACDRRGRVFVTDGANGCVHRFSPSGRWEKCLPGFGKVTHLAIDCADHLYLVMEGVEEVTIIDTEGKRLDRATRPDEVAAQFPRLPFTIDAAGHLDLSHLCVEADQQNKVFDLHGNAGSPASQPSRAAYHKTGTYYTDALDSKLYRCQWHRLILRGEVPGGTSIQAATYTAEVLKASDQILALPEASWETRQTIYQIQPEEWEGLIRSNGGRYLWLRLQFKGNGAVTPAVQSIKIEFPRISLRRYLPAVFGEDPNGANFTDRFLSLFDTTLRSVEVKIDQQARYFDPLSAPASADAKTGIDFLTWLAAWIGLTLDRHWPESKRRQFLKNAGRLYHLRGTREGLWRQLLLYLEIMPESRCGADNQANWRCRATPANCAPVEELPGAWQAPPLILEHYQLRRWLFLGAGRLGDQAELWGKRLVNRSQLDAGAQLAGTQLITTQDPFRDPFHVYAHKFSVFVPACYGKSEAQRKALENLLNAERPAHTLYQLQFVAPRFRIGFQSMIGFDAVVGRYPQGVTLNQTPLGQASVLAERSPATPSLIVGKQARVGTTTKLD